jgi:hypothetical protein
MKAKSRPGNDIQRNKYNRLKREAHLSKWCNPYRNAQSFHMRSL